MRYPRKNRNTITDMFLKEKSLRKFSHGSPGKKDEARMEGMVREKVPLNSGMEGNKPISPSVKAEVYDRADGRCESCGEHLTRVQGEFHHFAKPRVTPSVETVQFLCPSCHKAYGHAIKVVVHRGLLRKWKETTIVRVLVKKHPKRTRGTAVKKPLVKKKKFVRKVSAKKAPVKKPSKKRSAQKKKATKKRSRSARSWFVPRS